MEPSKQSRMDHMYMDVAVRIAQMSYAKRKKVGSILVKDNNIISMGWNGTPSGEPNSCEGEDGETLPTVLHAELNMLCKIAASASASSAGGTVYITLSPCLDCAKLLLQSGIKRVVYNRAFSDPTGVNLLIKHGVEVEYIASQPAP